METIYSENAFSDSQRVIPFTALTGQDLLKQALLMLAVNPKLNGLLIRGEKGTAKSTAARGLATLLPEIVVNKACRFGCVFEQPAEYCAECRQRKDITPESRRPAFVTLPLNITEDQLIGSFDLEQALQLGRKRFQPGLLARVNQGVLYVDELNLLEDHIVDLLLDCAASGVNIVERDGISFAHPSRFMLVGTMNPEEGELRPQLQDRFGLCVDIKTITDVSQRIEIMERSMAFETDPITFYDHWAEKEAWLSRAITTAKALLKQVAPEKFWYHHVATLSVDLGVNGHRADILMIKALSTLAALDQRTEILPVDFHTAASLVYPHRLKRTPFEAPNFSVDELHQKIRKILHSFEDSKKKMD